MFTGIVQGKARVEAIEKQAGLHRLTIALPAGAAENLQRGASIAVNGVCLTVTDFDDHFVSFDVMMESLRATNLGDLKPGHLVNFERAARVGDEIGGHLLSGHVHTVATVNRVDSPTNNRVIEFAVDADWLRYILPKGYVALNGASLTVGEVSATGFNVYLIPETLKVTTFGQMKAGDRVNLEVDSTTQTVVDTVERLQGLSPSTDH